MYKFSVALLLSVFLLACSEDKASSTAPVQDVSTLFEGVEKADVDYENHVIVLNKWTDSLQLENLEGLEGKSTYLALDDDPVDPEIDWDSPLESGSSVAVGESGVLLVTLDDLNRIVAVWKIENPARKSSSSKAKSSSSVDSVSSSAESSSSEESSSSKAKSSSSDEPTTPSSSSVESSSGVVSSSSEISSSSVEEIQLPGSDFTARNDFWATTSDAMATARTAALIKISSEENLVENGNSITISSREVNGSLLVDGSWKMAGGYYFTGTYAGTTALDIYQQGYTSGTPSTDDSYIVNDMTFGKPFTARPRAFELTYSYNHVAGKSEKYPQKSLVYVMLLDKDRKVVALGSLMDTASVELTTRTVELEYGKDSQGILTGGYPVADSLTLGTGKEDVAEIVVMFASSAFAHVVSGGIAGNSGNYRGADGASLTLDQFTLIYQEKEDEE